MRGPYEDDPDIARRQGNSRNSELEISRSAEAPGPRVEPFQAALPIRSQTAQNFCISAGLPNEIRTKFSIPGKRRPIRMPFRLK